MGLTLNGVNDILKEYYTMSATYDQLITTDHTWPEQFEWRPEQFEWNSMKFKQEYPTQKEITMSDIVKEAVDKKARKRVDKILARYDEFLESDEFDDGDVICWVVKFRNRDTEYKYAAVWAAGRWHDTGGRRRSSAEVVSDLVQIEVDGGKVLVAPSLMEPVV